MVADHNQCMTLLTSNATVLEGAASLHEWGVIRASGADAASFLHGQLTNDFTGLAPGQARLAGHCSAKGRLLATFVAWRQGEDILLACSADLLFAALKRLSMFVLRAKCKLSDASAQFDLHGLAGPAATAWLGAAAPVADWGVVQFGQAQVVKLGIDRYLLAAPAGSNTPALTVLDEQAWRWLEVHSGVPRVVAATAELFVPQMVNFELVGGVNFQKGCYPGQEIVARSQYRGSIKRRAQLLLGDTAAQPGQEVFSSTDPGQPAGHVVLAAALPGRGACALVELKTEALAGGTLHLGGPQGPGLTLGTLPYAVPASGE